MAIVRLATNAVHTGLQASLTVAFLVGLAWWRLVMKPEDEQPP